LTPSRPQAVGSWVNLAKRGCCEKRAGFLRVQSCLGLSGKGADKPQWFKGEIHSIAMHKKSESRMFVRVEAFIMGTYQFNSLR
jgi:hypothetical protein